MEKLNHALAVILKKLSLLEAALHAEQRVIGHQHKVWARADKKQMEFEENADEQRKKARAAKKGSSERKKHKAAAARWNVKSEKQGEKAAAAKRRAQPHIAEAKRLAVRVHGLEQEEESVRAELKKLQEDHGVKISGNKATGGTRRQRVVAVALASVAACSSGKRANRYTQAGYWDLDHPITGEGAGARSDCSQWELAVCKCAGIPDPTGHRYADGYTGTILTAKTISRANLKPACAVVYGGGNGFHTELFIGPGQRTAGHGSPPIDFGIIDLIPGAEMRFRDLVG